MAGFSKLYVIGGLGGFQGSDGVNPIHLQIWVGESDRQWLEPHYVDSSIKPIGAIRSIVPEGPDHPNALVDACIAFFPAQFKECPSLPLVEKALQRVERLDFHLGKDNIPTEWPQLREEARPAFEKLNIFRAELHRL